MKRFYPTIYQKSIFEIPYQKLKEQGICLLIFDLDNTIALIDQGEVDEKTKELFRKLQKDFQLVIVSNNNYGRVQPYAEKLQCDFVASALKPLRRGYKKIMKKYGLHKEQMSMIGDQLITDVYGGNRMTGCTILVDPLGKKDLKISTLNRILERMIFRHFEKTGQMKKGVYYE
ncbi:MAG: YqeG family HAD IIIA-type phosphatase [Bacilli bacterium]|nr:YqeG family HAD IIIA-type phosphatase [Bacilli bacterium]